MTWRVTLPNGSVLLYDDWFTAHIEASLQEYTLCVPLIPEEVEDELPSTGS
ncbi:hypothetical protein QTH87_23570 [Variovorax sp. J22P168]|uniref:hypothetical protein n=1 Tax=Variovorax jilinensis TaxID=3053513 RepID=UPI0025775F2D|nr:hypothetical protein [Variovorax sp. J22P168]MDM0015443.1 hypothetical protein [Variovorax sp. J22P168]